MSRKRRVLKEAKLLAGQPLLTSDGLLTSKEVGRIMDTSTRLAASLMARHLLRGAKVGGSWRTTQPLIDQYFRDELARHEQVTHLGDNLRAATETQAQAIDRLSGAVERLESLVKMLCQRAGIDAPP
jgi:hypothetical protein